MATKSLTYTLVIDKDQDHILSLLLNLAMLARTKDGLLFIDILKEKGLLETFENLLEDKADKCHEREWCTDPECEFQPKKDE